MSQTELYAVNLDCKSFTLAPLGPTSRWALYVAVHIVSPEAGADVLILANSKDQPRDRRHIRYIQGKWSPRGIRIPSQMRVGRIISPDGLFSEDSDTNLSLSSWCEQAVRGCRERSSM